MSASKMEGFTMNKRWLLIIAALTALPLASVQAAAAEVYSSDSDRDFSNSDEEFAAAIKASLGMEPEKPITRKKRSAPAHSVALENAFNAAVDWYAVKDALNSEERRATINRIADVMRNVIKKEDMLQLHQMVVEMQHERDDNDVALVRMLTRLITEERRWSLPGQSSRK